MADDFHPERVPDCESASVDDRKFRDYLLNESHTQGAGKAKFFKQFGFDQSNWEQLRDAVVTQVPRVAGRFSKANEFTGGANYEAVIRVEAPGGTIDVATYWEVHPSHGTKFLTAYPSDTGTAKREDE